VFVDFARAWLYLAREIRDADKSGFGKRELLAMMAEALVESEVAQAELVPEPREVIHVAELVGDHEQGTLPAAHVG
jgi:hypothetical protein